MPSGFTLLISQGASPQVFTAAHQVMIECNALFYLEYKKRFGTLNVSCIKHFLNVFNLYASIQCLSRFYRDFMRSCGS